MRPENVRVTRRPGSGQIAGQVELVEALGAETLIYADARRRGSLQLVARQNERTDAASAGDAVGLDIEPASLHLVRRVSGTARRRAPDCARLTSERPIVASRSERLACCTWASARSIARTRPSTCTA